MKLTDTEGKKINHMKKTSGSALAVAQFFLPLYLIVFGLKSWSTVGTAAATTLVVIALIIAVLFFGYWLDVRRLIAIIDKYEDSK